MGKIATDETLIGEQGVGLIARTVSAMGHFWHPTSGADSGVDGEIELRDPATKKVRNVRIGVQSKATSGTWPAEDDDGFSFSPTYDDIEYWLSSNQPVIVVCSRPATGEAYWRSVQEWAHDPTRRAKRTIHFDKDRDRFDRATRDVLFNLKATEQGRVEPPGPAPEPEDALTNLMPTRWQTDTVWSAGISGVELPALFESARDAGFENLGLAFHEHRVWSLRELPSEFVAAIGARERAARPLAELLNSEKRADLNLLRQLVRHDLIDRHNWWLRWHAFKKVVYFRRRGEQQAVSFSWATKPGRTVVRPQFARSDGHFTGYRHDASELHVRRLGDVLYLEVSPTYLFTWDGKHLSGHHDSALAGIHRQDRHASVSQMLRMWATLLKDENTIDGHEHPFTLGPLVEVRVPQSIPDKGWKEVSLDDLGAPRDEELVDAEALPDDDGDDLRLFTDSGLAA